MAEYEKTQIYEFPQEEHAEIEKPARSLKLPLINPVKLTGFLLLFLGVSLSLFIAAEIVHLYKNPKNIAQLAFAIEQGSNIDQAFTHKQNDSNDKTLRLSYFVAWLITFMLIILISMIGLAFIKTGASLLRNNHEKPIHINNRV